MCNLFEMILRFSFLGKLTWAVVPLLLILSIIETSIYASELTEGYYEINTVLMETTFRIEGTDEKKQSTTGTVFIIGSPNKDKPSTARHVLVTAAHVLDGIKTDVATLHFREKIGPDEWKRVKIQLPIRSNGVALWTKHPDADVAVMYIALPKSSISKQLGTPLLADDDMLRQFEIHPGETLYCLGFPLWKESTEEGFPVLRSGTIASYPLLPTKSRKTFLFAFQVFGGNSGGPVYFSDSNRVYDRTAHTGQITQFLVGLVSKKIELEEHQKGIMSEHKQTYPLGLAEVVHASLIMEAIALLP